MFSVSGKQYSVEIKMKKLDRLKLFSDTAKNSAAYGNFLKEHSFKPEFARDLSDWTKIPESDKSSYIKKYSRKELAPFGILPPLIHASSGSSGAPTYWFRDKDQEDMGGKIHELIFRDSMKINPEEETLVVICLGMGIWVAGQYTLASCERLAENGFKMSIITPGLEKEDIMRIFKDLAPDFKNVVLVGYPPFIMDIIAEMENRKIKFPRNFKIMGTGDKFSEEWRNEAARRAGIKDKEHGIISVYGSADATIIGYETPRSIFIRRETEKLPLLRKEIFGDESVLPSIVQYDERFMYLESQNGELLLTSRTAVPLIRYNIHDRGEIVSYGDMRDILRRHDLLREAEKHGFKDDGKNPFVILKGRSDVALMFYAINIYPEHLKSCFSVPAMQRIGTGSYLAYQSDGGKIGEEKFYLHVELRDGARASVRLLKKALSHVVSGLRSVSTEFRKLHDSIGKKALPKIRLIRHGKLTLPKNTKKGLLQIKGKKPRIVLS